MLIIFKILFGKLKRWKQEQDDVKEGVLALLHNELYQQFRYYITKNEITESELKNIECLYRGYHALGGNGTGTELYARVLDLPLKTDQEVSK